MEPSLTEPNFSREPKFFFFEVFLYEKFNNRNSGMEKKVSLTLKYKLYNYFLNTI